MTYNPYAFIMTGMNRSVDRFTKALRSLEGFETEGLLLKVEYENVKAGINNAFDEAWKTLIREPFIYNGRWENLTEAERKLEQSFSIPYAHVLPGYQKRTLAATKAAGPMRDAMLKYFAETVPVAERLVALKTKIGKRPPSKTSKTAMAQAERAAKAMTCQCCARDILAETGVIAHHGYQRPMGWHHQTASCDGALHLPFEVSRDALGALIARLRNYREGQAVYLMKVERELIELPLSWDDKSGMINSWDKPVRRTSMVTRETYDQVSAEIEPKRVQPHFSRTVRSFDLLKESISKRVAREIETVDSEIARQQARYDGWKQTHQRQGDQWVALSA